MVADGVSSTGISYARTSTIVMVSSFGAQSSEESSVAKPLTSSGMQAENGDTVTLLKGGEATDATPTRRATEANGSRRRETARKADGVVFVYNFKGDLRIKFMDSFNNLVYQMPPEFFTRLSDIMDDASAALDMTV
jgi:hypothetical protein